ncbi:helix-turn-helix domain-containing protein [Megamonas sp.]|uniref:MarR family transcriptional regulator n=1 Tax=Megamonas sp. TaxID=2049033 RepID=UPI00258575C9|nr:helix-turn-helix domain-containing protein [Megamonas sp.]
MAGDEIPNIIEKAKKANIDYLKSTAFIKYYLPFFKLGLNADELHTLNLIFSFEANNKIYIGSSKYLCDMLNYSKPRALRILKSLTDKGYLKKEASNGRINSIYKINHMFLYQQIKNNENYSLLADNKQLQNVTVNSNKMLRLNNSNSNETLPIQLQNVTVNSNDLLPNKNIYKNNKKNNIYSYENKNEEKQKKPTSNRKTYSKNDFIYDVKSYSDNEELRQSLIDFYDMRKAQKKDINTSGITKRLLNKLDKLSGGDIEIKKIIVDKAIELSWLSFYPLNDADIATVKNKNNDVNEPKIKPVYENMLENDF